nr:capsular polysaccharide biosynthesis protein [Profundibacterium mesophilum]
MHVFGGGFLLGRRRRILELLGWRIALGLPRAEGHVAVWGRAGAAHRGEAVAARRGAHILRLEDPFLRSLHPGRAGEPPMGLLIDRRGAYFDSAAPSDLEHLLAGHPLDDTALLDRARAGIQRMQALHLSKYCAVDPAAPLPEPGYVLVVDQTRGDASIEHGAGSAALFAEMLAFARIENPGARIVIKTHPETAQGYRAGHYGPSDLDARTQLLDTPVSPWTMLEGAVGVYAVTSQLGFEAILAGHRPRIFGQPFYGGWGLTQDESPVPRRSRRLTRAQLFAGAMILYPVWYDPWRDRIGRFEDAMEALGAQARTWREDRGGYVAAGMRLWKRPVIRTMFGGHGRLSFGDPPERAARRAAATGRSLLVWAGRMGNAEAPPPGSLASAPVIRVEDGFLRSRGLGAALVPPLSLVRDDLGIYYDPARPSRLERLIGAAANLPGHAEERAARLRRALVAHGLSKYNLGGSDAADALAALPPGRRRILVAGQVEDDASILCGAPGCGGNRGLLAQCRAARPDAAILYKPHPDVEAGLRRGAVEPAMLAGLADANAPEADPVALLDHVEELWTMTSLVGFEALLRGLPVVCTGMPFYAGWGLTHDVGPPDGAGGTAHAVRTAARRTARPSLDQLVHAVLIDYPRYRDPVSGLPCTPEVIVERLAEGKLHGRGPFLRSLSKLQGLLATAGLRSAR